MATEVFSLGELRVEATIDLKVRVLKIDDLVQLGAAFAVVRLERMRKLDAVVTLVAQALEHLIMVAVASCLVAHIPKPVVVCDERAAQIEKDAGAGL